MVKNTPAKAGDVRDTGLIPGLGKSPGRGNGTIFQYSCLENSTVRGAWQAVVHGGHKELDTTEHTHGLSCLSSFTKHNAFKLHPHCSTYQNLTLFAIQ